MVKLRAIRCEIIRVRIHLEIHLNDSDVYMDDNDSEDDNDGFF